MKKNVLLSKLNGCKRPVMIFMLAIITCLCSFAQTQITGRVTSDDGSELPGASVTVKGSSTGTVTDMNGEFKLSAPENAVLVIKFIGYKTQEVTVGSRTSINVRLLSDSESLSEVAIVSIGYGTSRVKDLTGSVSSISAKEIEQIPVTTLDQALQGRAAGVQVTNNDGAPGGNVNVMIRGVGSLASNGNGPLYIVDGYPLDGGLNNINPSDIASIDVLKDASSTAIYGIRAANGVVIVNTKKGLKNRTQVSLDAYSAIQGMPKKYDILNAQEWATLANEIGTADKNFNRLPEWLNPSSLATADWQNALYRTGLTQNYSLAIRGGSEKVQAATSIGYYDQKGIVEGSYFKRLSLGLNLDYQPVKWLKSASSAKYSNRNQNDPFGTGNLGQLTQLIPTLDGGNKMTNQIKDANGNYGFFNPVNTYTAKYNNPLYGIETNEFQNLDNFLLTTTSLEATIFEGLKLKTNAGLNLNTFTGSFYQPEETRIGAQYPGSIQTNANYSQRQRNTFDWLWENTLAYDKTFGKHTLNFLAGVSAQSTRVVANGGSGIPANSVIRDLNQVTNQTLDVNGNGQTLTSLASQFGRLNYNFNDRYIITGTVRRDGSSKFAEGSKFGVFPTGAIAWRAKNESFLKDVNWLSDLKFRASYGKVGNQGPIQPFQYQTLYSTGLPAGNSNNLGYPFNKVYQKGIAASQPANDNLRWEIDYQTDIGVDASFLNGDLNFTLDWFNRKSQDFLLRLESPAQTGFPNLTRNVGAMENKGIEFATNYKHTVRNFRYGIALTLSSVKNTLTELASGTDAVGNFGGLNLNGTGWGQFTNTRIGGSVGDFYGYKSLGIFQSKAQIDALNAASKAKNPANEFYQKTGTSPGDRYFADTNGDGRVTPDDQVNLGSPQPDLFGGLIFDAGYKAWDINLYFYGVTGNKILNYQKSNLESFQNRGFVGVQNVSREYYEGRWTPTNPSNTMSRAILNDDAILSNVPSSAWIEDGSFFRLKNLTIGYTLPADLMRKVSINRVRLYASTQNLFTITKYSGLDPEIGIRDGNPTQTGVDNGVYPGSKFYTFGLNLTF